MKQISALLLYGIDENTLSVDGEATRDQIRDAGDALRERGWRVAELQWPDNLNAALEAFPRDEWLVFNFCEGSPAQPFYFSRAARELENRGYAFTGSDATALHLTQFKPSMKKLLEAARLPGPRWTVVKNAGEAECLVFDLFPAIVKPAGEHCSFGVTRESVVFDLEEARRQAVAVARQFPDGAIVEEFLDSDEFAVSLIGADDSLEILGISVIHYGAFSDMRDRLFTFEAKWLSDSDAYQKTMPVCPAPVSGDLRNELESLARRAHCACGARDYSRVDIRLLQGRPRILDVNTNCALGKNSGFVETARIGGLNYGPLLERLASLAARRSKLFPANASADRVPAIQSHANDSARSAVNS